MDVVVVDGERMFAEALARFLDEQEGIDVVDAVRSITESIDSVAHHRPQVLTTGYRLPDGDAVDLMERLGAVPVDLRVVVVSALEQPEVVAGAIDAGCAGFVPKSAVMADVATAVRSAATGQTVIAPSILRGVLEHLRGGPRWHGTRLTAMEYQIVQLLPAGLSDREMGQKLGLTERSVRNHMQSLLAKLDSHSKLEGLATAIRRGIVLI